MSTFYPPDSTSTFFPPDSTFEALPSSLLSYWGQDNSSSMPYCLPLTYLSSQSRRRSIFSDNKEERKKQCNTNSRILLVRQLQALAWWAEPKTPYLIFVSSMTGWTSWDGSIARIWCIKHKTGFCILLTNCKSLLLSSCMSYRRWHSQLH